MIFEAFEWPYNTDGLNVEVHPKTWKILRSSPGALHTAYNPIRGKWCYIEKKPFFMICENENIIIHFDGSTWNIPKYSTEFQISSYNFFLWNKFIFKKGQKLF